MHLLTCGDHIINMERFVYADDSGLFDGAPALAVFLVGLAGEEQPLILLGEDRIAFLAATRPHVCEDCLGDAAEDEDEDTN